MKEFVAFPWGLETQALYVDKLQTRISYVTELNAGKSKAYTSTL